jgi:hypothetical protein
VNYSLILGDKHSSNGLAPNIFGARAMVVTLRLTNGYIRKWLSSAVPLSSNTMHW